MAKYKEVMIITEDENDRELFAGAVKIVSPNSNIIGLNGADCGIDYLTDINSKVPDIIFLDKNLKVIGYTECYKKIKKHSFLMHVPVIMYSTTELPINQINSLKTVSKQFRKQPIPIRLLCEELKAVI